MIPLSHIIQLEAIPVQHQEEYFKKCSTHELEETRQELLEFRDSKNQLRYRSCYTSINSVLSKREMEVNMQ